MLVPDRDGRHDGRPRLAVSDLVAPVPFLVLCVPLARQTFTALRGVEDAPVALLAILVGVAATDLVSGVVHWMCDVFFAEETPLVGAALIRPFREHHRDPTAMTRERFLRVNRSCFFGMAGVLLLAGSGSGSLFGRTCLLAFSGAVGLTNQFHLWAHAAHVPAPVRWLQRTGLVISPAAHARHHDGGGRGAFCITTGWLNPTLDALAVLPRLERGLRALGRRLSPPARHPSRHPAHRPTMLS